jgi:hypothetical protein
MLWDCLDRSGCADGHEGRGLDQAMRQRQGRSPRLPTDGFYLKSERHVGDSSLRAGNASGLETFSAVPAGLILLPNPTQD